MGEVRSQLEVEKILRSFDAEYDSGSDDYGVEAIREALAWVLEMSDDWRVTQYLSI